MWNEPTRREKGGTFRLALLLPLLLLLVLPAAGTAADEEGCLFCHRHPLVSAGSGGGARSLKVSDPQDGPHGSLYCSDCHGDARTVPHPVRPGAASCAASCHASATPLESHRAASWGGLTESHRAFSQPVPPCLLCHRGGDRKGDRGVLAARCSACHPAASASVRTGIHGYLASSGGAGACAPCHPPHAASTAQGKEGGAGKGTSLEPRCTGGGCHVRVSAAMVRLAGHAGAAVPGTGGAAALLVAALLPGLLAALPFTSRGGEAGAPARSWITSIPRIPRYSVAQRIQHFLAFALFLALFASAAARAVAPGPLSHAVHVRAGEGAAILLLLHLAYLVQKAVRLDLPVSEVALLPFADAEEGEGKYSRSERWDYLLLVTFALLLAVTGILLRWPGSAGLSPKGYGAVRLVHLFFGAVAAVHLVAGHARLRLLRGGEGSALSIVTGSVPLATAEGRPGWIRRLVEAGTLVPVPEEKGPTAESREGTLVRELLEEGNRLARGGDFGGARRKFAEALVHYPEYSQARFNLAVACMKGGDREEAAAHFAAFLEADPFNPVAEKAREYLEACRKEGTS